MTTKTRGGHAGRWPARQRKLAGALALLLLGAAYWQAHTLSMPWQQPAEALAAAAAQPAGAQQLAGYQASIQHRPIAGIVDNLSGLTYDARSGTLFGVTNRPPAVVELSTEGQLLRSMPVRGVRDPEGIAHIRDDWFAIADERRNRIHWVQIGPGQREVQTQQGPVLALGEASIKNFGLEGLGWDSQRQQLLAVTEKWPLQVLALDGPVLTPGARNLQLATHPWESQDAAGVPSTDLASIEVDPRSGNLLLLGEESSVLYEYTRAGELLGMMPLWAGLSGLDESIGQPEGVAIDAAGTLYIVAEPNLFYRFDKQG